MRLTLLLGAAVVAASITIPALADSADRVALTARMTAEEEVATPGPPGAKGTALLDIDEDASQLCYQLSYSGITKPNAGKVHRGAKGAAGPPVLDLDVAKNGDKACTQANRETLHDIVSDPPSHYVNLYTADFPDGAIRGQLTRGPLTTPGRTTIGAAP